MMQTVKIDLSKTGETLLSGRKNGERARTRFDIKDADNFIMLANDDQLITSSYFLGLLSEVLIVLAKKENGNINELLKHVDLNSLNEKSKDECVRAIRRSITKPRSLMGH